MAIIAFDDGVVHLGDQQLPGILTSLHINGSFKSDSKEPDQMSGSVRTPLGWNDADITLEMDLTTDDGGADCYEKLRIIDKIFKWQDKDGDPQIYQIANKHMRARGIRDVSFEKLKSSESDQNDMIKVILSFKEFDPPVIQLEKNAAKIADKAVSVPSLGVTEPDADPDIFAE